ncbi:MAG: hypothetical protein AAF358_22900 [Pseudomonadota bacterium]
MVNGRTAKTLILLLAALLPGAASLAFELNDTPATEVLNGITAPSRDFAIAVGNAGEILHFQGGDNGTLQPPVTTNDLFDVYAASPTAAIAAGRDIVLYWDGSTWSPIIESGDDLAYTGLWITPEEDAALYGQLATGTGFGFNFVCSYLPNSDPPLGPCRAYQAPMLTACGNSDDIKVILGSGDILNLDNRLAGMLAGDSVFDEAGNLQFTGAWPVPGSCLPGPLAPREIYATRFNEIWRFDGTAWTNQNVPVPGTDTLSWIGGTGPGNVIAVGFRPGGNPGENIGIAWRFDGETWSELTLPAGTPGLTDIAANLSFQDTFFMDGFEAAAVAAKVIEPPPPGGLGVDILAAAEDGKFLQNTTLFPDDAADITVTKELITPGPYRNGDRIEYRITVFNLGPGDASDIRFLDGYRAVNLTLADDGCGMSEFNNQAGWRYRDVNIPSLALGETLTCVMSFDVMGDPGDELFNYAAADSFDDTNFSNNRDEVFSVPIDP